VADQHVPEQPVPVQEHEPEKGERQNRAARETVADLERERDPAQEQQHAGPGDRDRLQLAREVDEPVGPVERLGAVERHEQRDHHRRKPGKAHDVADDLGRDQMIENAGNQARGEDDPRIRQRRHRLDRGIQNRPFPAVKPAFFPHRSADPHNRHHKRSIKAARLHRFVTPRPHRCEQESPRSNKCRVSFCQFCRSEYVKVESTTWLPVIAAGLD
jgi:hypothetical protein